MYHNTYDRIRGSWWGAIVAQSQIERLSAEPQLDLYSQPWLIQRQKVATLLLKRELSSLDLEQLIADLQHNSSLLSLLPAIALTPDKPILQLKNIVKRNLELVSKPSEIAINQNVLGWNYLLTSALHHKLDLIAQKRVIEEVIEHHLESSGWLADKLSLVVRGIENGSSLGLIVEQLLPLKDRTSTAIALAWYCFVTTPEDFGLSIKRASLVTTNLTRSIVLLTGTLSGAYNGMAEISAYGRADVKNPKEQLEEYLCQKLFQDWLGILSYEQQNQFYNPNLDAIAMPGVIQLRQSLKIISQT